MRYTKELALKITEQYKSGVSPKQIAQELGVPEKSIVAKLASLGVYVKKEYRNKRGEIPISKSQYLDRLAVLLGVDVEIIESLEKANKNVLKILEDALR